MSFSRRDFLSFSGAAAILASWGGPFARSSHAGGFVRNRADPAVYHFLNRISYGVRPEDVEHATEIGIEAYLDEQLNPESIKGASRTRVPSALKLDRLRAAKGRNANEKCRVALIQGMVARAANSPAQLYERVVEFWSDHFNIASVDLEPDLVDFQREVIRKHAFGNFRELLLATARHPAMLFYLDNYLNVAKHPQENYARELMELHTLGVDGGYTEADVKAVAKAFTGWTVNDNEKPGGFFFRAKNHDINDKVVLGVTLPRDAGVGEAEFVIDMLAAHPNTARFICKKLCVRFVSDYPPQTLLDTLTGVWIANNGDIKPVLRALFLSPEFANSAGQKLRRPLDFFIGALRLTKTEFKDFGLMNNLLQDLAQVPYNWEPPNGYPDVAQAWANTGGLLQRWNISQILTDTALNDKKSGMKTKFLKSLGKPVLISQLVDAVSNRLFAAPLPDDVRNQMIAFVSDGAGDGSVTKELIEEKLGVMTGILLASPMFQWR